MSWPGLSLHVWFINCAFWTTYPSRPKQSEKQYACKFFSELNTKKFLAKLELAVSWEFLNTISSWTPCLALRGNVWVAGVSVNSWNTMTVAILESGLWGKKNKPFWSENNGERILILWINFIPEKNNFAFHVAFKYSNKQQFDVQINGMKQTPPSAM